MSDKNGGFPDFVRVSAKALITENDAILAIRMRRGNTVVYVLPGGGQNLGDENVEIRAE